jgi:hypothetical protein
MAKCREGRQRVSAEQQIPFFRVKTSHNTSQAARNVTGVALTRHRVR